MAYQALPDPPTAYLSNLFLPPSLLINCAISTLPVCFPLTHQRHHCPRAFALPNPYTQNATSTEIYKTLVLRSKEHLKKYRT